MTQELPSLESIAKRLNAMSNKQIHWLASSSGVPYSTLMNIRYGTTKNSRYETVVKILPHLMPE